MSGSGEHGLTCGDHGGVRVDGQPCECKMGRDPESGLCKVHDPKRKAEVYEMRVKGAKAKAEADRRRKAANPKLVPKPPRTLQDAVDWSSWDMHAVAVGEIDARTGHEIGYLVNAFKAAVEKRDLLREIEELRAELAQARAAQCRPKVS